MSRILVVEDHPFNRRLVRDVLEYRGHDVIEAIDVGQACERLRTMSADIVLLDVQIPGGGGDAVVRAIRSDPALRHVPVVAVTALAMAGDRARILTAGYDGYISKPIDTKTFGAEIEAFIARGRSS